MSSNDAAVLSRVKGGAIDGRLRVLRIRQRLFKSLHSALVKHHDAALHAIQSDGQFSLAEAQIVYGSALIELRNHYDDLDLKTDLYQEYALAKGRSNVERRVPIALTYIVPGTYTPFYGVLTALCGALEAGSCVVVELENDSLKSSNILRKIIASSLDPDAFGVVSSRAPAEFLSACVIVDQAGTITSSSSAKRLLTSPLHRNVAIVDRTCDVELAAKEIVASRQIFGGKSFCAVDIVLVNEYAADAFLAAVDRFVQSSKDSSTGVNGSTSLKHRTLANRDGSASFEAEIHNGKAKWANGSATSGVLEVTSRDTQLVTAKIPPSDVIVLNRITSMDDAIDFLSSDAAPICALYLFSGSREAKYLSQYIQSLGTYVNHIPAQLSVGPTSPANYPINLRMRYTRGMFELPSPQVVLGPRSHLTSSIVKNAAFIEALSIKPLKPTGQPKAGAWGFFEQGMVIGLFAYLLPITFTIFGGTGWAIWKGWQKVKG